MPRLVAFAKRVLQGFSKDKVGQLSAAFSYGAIFSIGPLLLVLISIAGLVFGARAAQGQLFSELAGVVGSDTARTIQSVVQHTHQSKSGVLALVLGAIGMLLGAAGITTQLQNAFNTILGVVPDPKGGIKRTIYVKLKNVVLVILGSLLVIASIIASVVLSSLGGKAQEYIGLPPLALELFNNLLSLAVFVLLLYVMYRTLPDVLVPRKIVVSTALFVSVMFLIGKVVLGFIIGRNGAASAYGAAASLVTLLLWIYYSGQIIFIGAEIMKVYGEDHGLTYKPKKFSLKRHTVEVDAKDLPGRMLEAWTHGFKKGRR